MPLTYPFQCYGSWNVLQKLGFKKDRDFFSSNQTDSSATEAGQTDPDTGYTEKVEATDQRERYSSHHS